MLERYLLFAADRAVLHKQRPVASKDEFETYSFHYEVARYSSQIVKVVSGLAAPEIVEKQ